jgi:hypothetical protein
VGGIFDIYIQDKEACKLGQARKTELTKQSAKSRPLECHECDKTVIVSEMAGLHVFFILFTSSVFYRAVNIGTMVCVHAYYISSNDILDP